MFFANGSQGRTFSRDQTEALNMLYLTFDSNIWIYLLDSSWKETNPLDHLDYWIEGNSMKILIPEIIIEEWQKHRDIEKEKRVTKLKEFFLMAADIIPSGFIEAQRNRENLQDIIDQQIKRIEVLLHQRSEIIPVTDVIKSQVFDWGLLKKAPMHKKTSVADALIVFSIFEFAANNKDDEYIFISANTDDFYGPDKKSIHEDLAEYFTRHNIELFKHLDHLINELKKRYPVTVDLSALKNERLINRIRDKAFNPAITRNLTEIRDSVVGNKEVIDTIARQAMPSRESVMIIWGLIESDESYREYFYKKAWSPAWFPIMRERGEFEPSKNPLPLAVEKGYTIPYWPVLSYFETLSIEIAKGGYPELVPELIKLIKNISANPQDNYITWLNLLRVLEKLPNEQIEAEIFEFIPVWLGGEIQNSSQSRRLCEMLLPKFLNETPTADDIVKGELILHHLLQLRVKEEQSAGFNDRVRKKYVSVTDVHYLSAILLNKDFQKRLATYTSDYSFFNLATRIRDLVYFFPDGIHAWFKIREQEHAIVYRISGYTLSVVYQKVDEESIICHFDNYTDLQVSDILKQVGDALDNAAPGYVQTNEIEDPLTRLKFFITADLSTNYNHISVFKIGRHRLEDTFTVYLKGLVEWLSTIVVLDPERGTRLTRMICFDRRYNLPILQRTALQVISDNWIVLKEIFWELSDKENVNIFSGTYYKKEIYDLLQMIQNALEPEEKNRLQEIINAGAPDSSIALEDQDRWRLGWLAALRGIQPFTDQYDVLSGKLNLSYEHFANRGELMFKSGSVSPVNYKELLKDDIGRIAEFIKLFRLNEARDFTISALSEELTKAVREEPGRFSEGLQEFAGVPYIYAYSLFQGFTRAIEDKKLFNLSSVLEYAASYSEDPLFQTFELLLDDDSWNADAGWVAGSIADLLTVAFTQKDTEPDFAISPLAIRLLTTLVNGLPNDGKPELTGTNYPQYVINAPGGKLFRALLDYALFVHRRSEDETEQVVKWDTTIKEIFEKAIERHIPDIFILVGMYFDHFYYLDKAWTISQVEKVITGDDYEFDCFAGGFAFNHAPNNHDLFQVFLPLYKRAIQEDQLLNDKQPDLGLVRHLVAYYFYGFEDIPEESMLFRVLEKKDAEVLLQVITFMWQQSDYKNQLSPAEKVIFEQRIISIWSMLYLRFKDSKEEKEHNVAGALVHLTDYLTCINAHTAILLAGCARWAEKQFHTHELFEALNRLKGCGSPGQTASYLAGIVHEFTFRTHLSDQDQDALKEITEFLYENGEKDSGNDVCNRLSKSGNEFLNEMYRKYNAR